MSTQIETALSYWHDRLSKEYGEDKILNITLYGSQNYNIDTPYSDVDVKAIFVPSLKEAISTNKRLSLTLHNEKNEHCEIKDIREMFEMYKKQNINFLETLFTPYRWENPNYPAIHAMLHNNAEKISHYNSYSCVRSLCGQAKNATIFIRDYPTDNKKIANVYYFYLFLNKYLKNIDYKKCLYVEDSEKIFNIPAREMLIALKTKDDLTLASLIPEYHHFFESSLTFLKEFFTFLPTCPYPWNYLADKTVPDLLDNIAFDTIQIYEQIKGDKNGNT